MKYRLEKEQDDPDGIDDSFMRLDHQSYLLNVSVINSRYLNDFERDLINQGFNAGLHFAERE
jgi:hypothetical protein